MVSQAKPGSTPLMDMDYILHSWRECFRSPEISQVIQTLTATIGAGGATQKSEKIALPNLGRDVFAVSLRLSAAFTAGAAETPVANSILIDILDSISIKDPDGRSVINMSSGRSHYEAHARFVDEAPASSGALTTFTQAGTSTCTAFLVVPVHIPKEEGTHWLQLEYAITNIYAADVAVVLTVDISVYAHDGIRNVIKWKLVDTTDTIVNGERNITSLETGRIWYGLAVIDLAAITGIDDVAMKSGGIDLIYANYADLAAIDALAIDYAVRAAGDAWLRFAAHYRNEHDYLMIEGTAGATIIFLLLADADQTRNAGPVEVKQGVPPAVATGILTPSAVGTINRTAVQPSTMIPRAY